MSAENLAAQQSRQQEGDPSAHLSKKKKKKKEQMQFEWQVAGVPTRKAQRLTLAWTVTAASDLHKLSTESIFRPEQQRIEFMSFTNERIKCYWKLRKHLNTCCSE